MTKNERAKNVEGVRSSEMDIPREPEPRVNEASDAAGGGGVGGEKLCKPRKPHRCRLCNERIEIGEPCHRYSGLEPGEGYYTIYTHPECLALTKDWDDGDWECCSPGEVVRPKAGAVAGGRVDVREQSGAGSTTGQAHPLRESETQKQK